ncbi:hypothetical protein Cni_G27487 [Canna indica]|uniref:Uncharacterized protein n=1 Tax=Canna indica TaxID=4628 RepID=A0AAQ3QSA1_9LILI|nr:hypothetical protein Cni_G27487 [Canna indica]
MNRRRKRLCSAEEIENGVGEGEDMRIEAAESHTYIEDGANPRVVCTVDIGVENECTPTSMEDDVGSWDSCDYVEKENNKLKIALVKIRE